MANLRWGRFFTHDGQEKLANYLTTYNMATQTIALDANANDIQSSGGGAAMLNGLFIPALAADEALDISAATIGDAVGTVLANGQSCYFLITAAADGTLAVWKAGDVALDAAVALKIPEFDPTLYIPVAIMLVDAAGDVTIGTTALTGIATFYQLTGPVLPHPDKLAKTFTF